MKRKFAQFALLMSMFVLFGCTSSTESTTSTTDTTTSTTDATTNITIMDTTTEVSTGPLFTGVLMAVGDEKSYIEETLLSSSLESETPSRLGFSHKLLPLSSATNSDFSFEGTIINGIYVSTKGNIEYLVIDIVQTVDLADSYTFNNIVIGSNGWTTDKIFTLGSENNKFYTSDDLTKIYIPVKITTDVSTKQEFTVKSIKYLDGVSYKAVRFADDVVDSIDILVAGNPIVFTSLTYDMPSKSISMYIENPDNLPIAEIQINNQVAYTAETYNFPNSGDVTITIPEGMYISTFNWVKVKITYSVLESADVSSEYTTFSEVFLAMDDGLVYNNGNFDVILSSLTFLIRSGEDLAVFGSDYFERVDLIIVEDIDLTNVAFTPLNVNTIVISGPSNPNIQYHEQKLYLIHVNTGFIFSEVEESHFVGSTVNINRVAFDNITYVGTELIYKAYETFEEIYFGEKISYLQYKSN